MAEERRGYVWLECSECGHRQKRTQRLFKSESRGKDSKPKCMDSIGRLKLKKFCTKQRKHTIHIESRKK